MQKVGGEKDHAEFSASGSHRWLNCPGSLALSKTAPPQRESEYAAEGTKAHECLEFLLKNRANMKKALKLAAKNYSAEMLEHASFAADWIMERAQDAELLCETKVDSSAFTCTGQFGTVDAAVVREFDRLTVIDFKYGAGIAVEPDGEDGKGNPQLVYYALALSHQYHHNFTEVELVVIQPRAYHESGDVVRSTVLKMEDLLAWGPRFRDGVMETSDPNAPLKAGSWCKFCPAAVICPELKQNAFKQAQVAFSDDMTSLTLPIVEVITLPHLGTILEGCYKLEAWIEKVREHALHVLERGGDVEGFKLVQKRSIRRWVNEEVATIEAFKKFGISALTTPKILSPAQLEKAVKGSDAWVAERTSAESSGTTLARQSDKRPAIKTLEEVFRD